MTKKVSMFLPTLSSIESVGIASSKDDVAPVITQVALTREGDALRAMATDRYMVVTGLYAEVQFSDWAEGETLLVDPKALKTAVQMGRAVPKGAKSYTSVDIIKDVNGVAWVKLEESTIQASTGTIESSFPPVVKLLPGEREANGAPMLNLRPDFLAKLAKVVPPEVTPDRNRTWQFRFFNDPERKTPDPVYAKYGTDGDTYQMEALIQPGMQYR